jgi:putative polyhydroxyalkanoate system protein
MFHVDSLLDGGRRVYGRALRRAGIDTHQLIPLEAASAYGLWRSGLPTGIIADYFAIDEEGLVQMAEISIVQQHSLSPVAARSAADKVAQRLAADYGLACKWDGDVLRFERSGVDGALTLDGQNAALRISLGFFMSAFAPSIEAKVVEKMRKVFIPA